MSAARARETVFNSIDSHFFHLSAYLLGGHTDEPYSTIDHTNVLYKATTYHGRSDLIFLGMQRV